MDFICIKELKVGFLLLLDNQAKQPLLKPTSSLYQIFYATWRATTFYSAPVLFQLQFLEWSAAAEDSGFPTYSYRSFDTLLWFQNTDNDIQTFDKGKD